MTTVADVMTRGVRTMSPTDTVVLAAQAMDELNVGVIPVCDGEKLVGMVTDRDIVVRGVAQEADTKTAEAGGRDEHQRALRHGGRGHRRSPAVRWPTHRSAACRWWMDSSAWWASFRWATSRPRTRDNEDDVGKSLGDISSPAEPDRSGQSRASGDAGGGSASGKPRRKPG